MLKFSQNIYFKLCNCCHNCGLCFCIKCCKNENNGQISENHNHNIRSVSPRSSSSSGNDKYYNNHESIDVANNEITTHMSDGVDFNVVESNLEVNMVIIL